MFEWIDVPGCKGYVVNAHGDVVNQKTGRFLEPSMVGRGDKIYWIIHFKTPDGHKTSRSLARVVCEAFNGPLPTQLHVVMHKDLNMGNCDASNLCWRTRAYRLSYAKQFNDTRLIENRRRFGKPVRNEDTGEVWYDLYKAAEYYGLLVTDILVSAESADDQEDRETANGQRFSFVDI